MINSCTYIHFGDIGNGSNDVDEIWQVGGVCERTFDLALSLNARYRVLYIYLRCFQIFLSIYLKFQSSSYGNTIYREIRAISAALC